MDTHVGLERKYLPTVRLRVRDYPGEERFRKQALREIGELKDSVVLILLIYTEYSAGQFVEAHKNAKYYNAQFVHAVRETLQAAGRKIASIFVVINKSDLLPADWDDETVIARVKAVNAGAIDNIETCFGESVQYRVTSAYTNKGVINLLGDVGRAVLTKPAEQDQLEKFLKERARDREFVA
jgi:hypothetical protein